jgi:hypothetical protein
MSSTGIIAFSITVEDTLAHWARTSNYHTEGTRCPHGTSRHADITDDKKLIE